MTFIHAKTTIWVWPTGLFPRRIIYFLRIKKITLSILTAHIIHLMPVQLTPTGLSSPTGLKARSEGTNVPFMRIEYADGTKFLIHETSAILEYMQEMFPDGPDMRDTTVQQRARSRDVSSLSSEAMVWSGVETFHSDPATASFSGLRVEDQSAAAAAHREMRFRKLLDKLEGSRGMLWKKESWVWREERA
jgi:hypothetical protein